MESDKKVGLDFRCKKLEIKQKYVTILMAGITITFTINLGLFLFFWEVTSSTEPNYCMRSIIFFLGCVLNVIGLIANLYMGAEFVRELSTIPPEDIKMHKELFVWFCSCGFGVLIAFWIIFGHSALWCSGKSKEGTNTSKNPITITSTGEIVITATGKVTITSANPTTTTTIGTGNKASPFFQK